MSIRNLEHLFRPTSLAVIGASPRPTSVGGTVMRNLLAGGFAGPIMPVNPNHQAVAGVLTYPDVDSLPMTPDLAVICTPPATVPGLITALAARGTRAAIVLTAGLEREQDAEGRTLNQAMLEAARPTLTRILGPNCVGLIVPGIGLNASFAQGGGRPGRIAFVTQSGALATAVLDWAESKQIGFSHFVSLGNGADVDFGDVLDYLGSDPDTRSILLYAESVSEARKFMSAARAAARNKPVLAVKAGRVPEGAKAAASHTGALAGSDDVFDAAIRRAGMLRVNGFEDLFDAAETLARARPPKGERLAILTNGGGPGVLATDAAVRGGGRLAELSDETLKRLDAVLPATWSRGNPVDIIGDAPVERYLAAFAALQDDPASDAILFLHAPTAIVPSREIAQALAPAVVASRHCVLACWLGGDGVAAARQIFAGAGIPTYDSPEDAVNAFQQLVDYRRNQTMLMETPAAPSEVTPDRAAVGAMIRDALAAGRELLSEPEAKAVLAAYGLPVVETRTAATPSEAAAVAAELGLPAAVKILSPDISHKSDVGGVALDLESVQAVEAAAEAMLRRVARRRPEARIAGFSVQRLARRPGAFELIVGCSCDPIFGPVLLFGEGGTAVEVIGDHAIALPPLNVNLARDLVSRTRIARQLAGYRGHPAADHAAIEQALIQVSELICEVPEIVELDINPLLADADGVLALDARIVVTAASGEATARLAIRPYPRELEETVTFGDWTLLLRPIRPEDEPQHRDFLARLEPEDLRFRFFGSVRRMAHTELARYTQIDYDREMAFIAEDRSAGNRRETVGVVRAVTDPDNERAEFAIIVRSDCKGRGLGRELLEKIIRYCRSRGTRELVGQVMQGNQAMLNLARRLGFTPIAALEPGIVELRLPLQTEPSDAG